MDAHTVIVVGAGPAGTRAAQRLARAGLRPILLDENERQGGQIYRRQPEGFTRSPEALYGTEAAKAVALHRDFEALVPAIDYRPQTLAWGVHANQLMTVRGDQVEALAFDALIIASGATDRIMPVPGWTTAGVYSLGGSQIALKAQACAIGSAPVFMGTGPLLTLVAWQYLKAGIVPAAVLDTSSRAAHFAGAPGLLARPRVFAHGLRYLAALRRAGVALHSGVTPLGVQVQDGRVMGVAWTTDRGRRMQTPCDAVGLGYGLRSENQLADLLKCKFVWDRVSGQWIVETDPDGRTSRAGVYLAGDGAAIRGADAAEAAGSLAACALLRDAGYPVDEPEMRGLRASLAPMDRFRAGLARAFPWPKQFGGMLPDETVVCRCENVTAGDIRRAATELDAPEINRAKALTRPGMGRCQGRMCGAAAAEILAHARGVPTEAVGRIRSAAPIKPLPLSARVVDAEVLS